MALKIADSEKLMRAWDFDKNVGVSPFDIPIRPRDNEQQKYYFKCPTCGESKLRNPRSIYKRGPICNSCKSKESWIKQGHQPKMMVADSEKLMSVWDAEKNVGMSPSDVPIHPSQGKEKKYYFKCPKCGESVLRTPSSVYRFSVLCHPCVSGKKWLQRNGKLAEKFPEIAKEWYQPLNGDVTPADVSCRDTNEYYWKCQYGHIYKMAVGKKTSTYIPYYCPVCSKSYRTSFTEQLIGFYMEKAYEVTMNYKIDRLLELDIYMPEIKTAVEYDGWRWHNGEKHARNSKRKHEYCNAHGITLYHVKECDGTDGIENGRIIYNFKKKNYQLLIDHICQLIGRERITVDIDRDYHNILARVKPVALGHSIADVRPDMLPYWDDEANFPLAPSMLGPDSGYMVYWRCPDCGHMEFNSPKYVSHRVIPCNKCTKKRQRTMQIKGKTDKHNIVTDRPDLLPYWDNERNAPITPDMVSPTSNNEYYWHCPDCGAKYKRRPILMGKGRKPCLECNKQTLSTKSPQLALYFDLGKNAPITPDMVKPFTDNKYYWKCPDCGYEEYESAEKVSSRVTPCLECSRKKRNANVGKAQRKIHSIATHKKLILQYWDYERNAPTTPDMVACNSTDNYYWKCPECGDAWQETPKTICYRIYPCKKCGHEKWKENAMVHLNEHNRKLQEQKKACQK